MKLRLLVSIGGLALMVLGAGVPSERLLDAALPGDAGAFRVDLLRGLVVLKVALILSGAWLVFLPRFLRMSPACEIEPRRSFVRDPTAWPWSHRTTVSLVVLLTGVSFVLRWGGAGQSFGGDEVLIQQSIIDRGLPTILAYWPPSTHHIGYEVCAWLSERLPLPVEMAARLPAALFGSFAVAVCFVLLRRILSPVNVIVFSLLHAVSLYGIAYSTMLKGYSAVFLCFTVALVAIVRILSHPCGWVGWGALGTSLAVMLYMHLHSVFLVVGLGLALLVGWCRVVGIGKRASLVFAHRATVAAISAILVVMVLYALPLPQVLRVTSGMGSRAEEVLGANFFQGWLMQLTFWDAHWPMSLVFCLLALVGLVSLARRELDFVLLFLIPCGVTVFLTWGAGLFLYPRYMLISMPPFLVFCVEGASAIGGRLRFRQGRALAAISVLLLFLLCVAPPLLEFYRYGQQNIRGAALLIESKIGDEDIAMSYGLARALLPYYNGDIRPVDDIAGIRRVVQSVGTRNVYLAYAWRRAWRGRSRDFKWIDDNFEVVHRFPGMHMDSCERDGDVVVMVRRAP